MLTHGLLLQTNLLQRQVGVKASFTKSVLLSLGRLFLFFSMACLGIVTIAEVRAEDKDQEEISEVESEGRRCSWMHIFPARPSSAQSSYSAQQEPGDLNSIRREMREIGNQLLDVNLEEMSPLVSRLHEIREREQLFHQLTQQEEHLRTAVLTTDLSDMASLVERLHEVREQRQLLLSNQTAANTNINTHAEPSIITTLGSGDGNAHLALSIPAAPIPNYASLTSEVNQQAIPAEGMEFIFPTISLESSTTSASYHSEAETESLADDESYISDASTIEYPRQTRQAEEKTSLNKPQVHAATHIGQNNEQRKQVNEVHAVTPHPAKEVKDMNANGPIRASNVALGIISPTSTDAVNSAQLFSSLVASKQYTDQRMSEVQQHINQVARNAYGAVAAAMAMPNQTPQQSGNTVIAVGGANFRGQSAVGFGVTHRSRNGQFLFHGAASTAGTAGTGVRVQLGYEF